MLHYVCYLFVFTHVLSDYSLFPFHIPYNAFAWRLVLKKFQFTRELIFKKCCKFTSFLQRRQEFC